MHMVHILTYKPNTHTYTVMSTSHKERNRSSILGILFLGPLFRLKVEQGGVGGKGVDCDWGWV